MRGLYAITPDVLATDALTRLVERALAGGIAMLQYRNKLADAALRAEQAQALLRLTRAAGVPLIINDDVALAAAIDADGAHVGRDDVDIAAARRTLPAKLLGASCYDRLDAARRAIDAGADHDVGVVQRKWAVAANDPDPGQQPVRRAMLAGPVRAARAQ